MKAVEFLNYAYTTSKLACCSLCSDREEKTLSLQPLILRPYTPSYMRYPSIALFRQRTHALKPKQF